MISTIIIDDNKIIREHFQKLIDWESEGFNLVSIANNGILGWQEFNKHQPQLVITDVQMPGMSGIELAKKIKEVSPDTMIVFISNYEDFNYVKAAMDIGVYDYILKHETRGKKLYEKLDKIRKEIEKENLNKRHYYESKLVLAFSSSDAYKLEQTFSGKYSLLLFEQISFLPPFSELTNMEMDEVNESEVQSLCYMYSRQIISAVRIEKYRYAVLLQSDCNLDSIAPELCKLLYDKTKTYFYVLPLCENLSITECFDTYDAFNGFLKFKFFNKHDCVIKPYNYMKFNNQTGELDIAEIMDAIKDTDIDRACELLDNYAQNIIENYNYTQLCKLTSKLLIIFIAQKKSLSKDKFMIYDEDDFKFWTYANEILFWLKSKLIQLICLMKKNPVSRYSETSKKAIAYINTNYMKSNLTVGEIAEHVGMDANHLNILIKKESGLTVIKWLTNTRIEKAKQLLAQQQKISYVCNEVGYVNISYFSNVFKKICGETPLEYRRRACEENH